MKFVSGLGFIGVLNFVSFVSLGDFVMLWCSRIGCVECDVLGFRLLCISI